MSPYTVRDTPEVVRRIEADLAQVVRTVRSGDPGLRSLILTGGFARGEGAVLDGAPQNDYDLVAVRGLARPEEPYVSMRDRLERRLGLHIDLAPVPAWWLPWAPPSVFWYETRHRGRVLWGQDALARIRACGPADLDGCEAVRLLGNRAAGLLLYLEGTDAEKRIQAAKALLAALDARLLAEGSFAPSQTERWGLYLRMRDRIDVDAKWTEWALGFKTEPAEAPRVVAAEAWRAAAQAVLRAVPSALRRAGVRDLDGLARRDGVLDHLHYIRHARRVPGAPRLLRNPTGRVRAATLRLLGAAADGRLDPRDAARCLRGLGRPGASPWRPLGLLEGLRGATRQ